MQQVHSLGALSGRIRCYLKLRPPELVAHEGDRMSQPLPLPSTPLPSRVNATQSLSVTQEESSQRARTRARVSGAACLARLGLALLSEFQRQR